MSVAAALMANGLLTTPAVSQEQAPAYPSRPKPPADAPNILVVMTDDVGFAASSAFGGPIPTPNLDTLAANGLRYNNYNNTAMCSPTRAALLTGRNSHSVGFGVISEEASPHDSYNSVIPDSAATFAQVLSMNGYDTAMLGKHHNTPLWEITSVGPFDHWPNGLGFGYFYGFIGGATNQFAPALYENRNGLEAPQDDPDYILDKDMADRAIDWLNMQHGIRSDTPFLMYYAPGSAHSPHQAPPEWIAKFRGQFDQGWDKMREQSFARQKKLGVIPQSAALTPRPDEIPAWSSLNADQKKVYARMMEVYAAQLAYSDYQFGRIISQLKENGEFDNTLIIFIEGDNGGSLEGSPQGTVDEIARGKNRMPDDLQDQLTHLDDFGTRYSWNNYPAGWAWSMNTPFQWGKAVASHLGGVRNGLVVSWPGHITGEGQVRSQFTHVTDIAPTIYEAAGVEVPEEVNGAKQMPLAGTSFAYSFRQPQADSRHKQQYFELRDNIAFYDEGWLASTKPRVMPWDKEAPPAEGTPVEWELYDLSKDFSQSKDLSKRFPEKLEELKSEYAATAKQYDIGVSPNEKRVERPFISNGQRHFVFRNSPHRYSRYGFPTIMNRSWTVTADIVVPEGEGDGAIIAQGSRLCGWGLVIENGVPVFRYNASIEDRDKTTVTASAPLSAGRHKITIVFDYDGGGKGKGADIDMRIDGKSVAQGRVPRTPGFLFVSEGGATIGRDYGTTLSPSYEAPFIYPGTINQVVIDFPE
ncbi:arylsulfatase [Altericroceibacterium spongiae]|nr:arylsulfatase [Altericroceibacterium spongiae]